MKNTFSKKYSIKPAKKLSPEGFFKKYKKTLDSTNWDLVEKYMKEFRYGL